MGMTVQTSRSVTEHLARWLRALFGLKPADESVLIQSAPLFAVVTATMVAVGTFTRAIFLTDHEIRMLPWVFLASAVFTSIASIAYISAMGRTSLTNRFVGLLVVAFVSFLGLYLLYPLFPKGVALLQMVWCMAIINLILFQSWNMMSAVVPSRQGKRLFPVLAAVSTIGAALGGGLVSVSAQLMAARHLMLVVLLLLAWPLWRVPHVVRKLAGLTADAEDTGQPGAVPGTPASGNDRGGEIGRAFRNILETPLLLRLAVLILLLQISSQILDYQFSAELKARFVDQKEAIASFLGVYYAMVNAVAFFVALVVTGRLVRTIGVGVAVSGSAIIVGTGGVMYLIAKSHGLAMAFWALVGTAFMDHVSQFSLTRNATQTLVMPLDARKGERAKTLIDGVVNYIGVATVSVTLLVLAPKFGELGHLSWGMAAACLGVVLLGFSIGAPYRRALFEGLRARRLDPDADPQTRAALQEAIQREVRLRLSAERPAEILRALEMARELRLVQLADDIVRLVGHADSGVVARTLEVIRELAIKPDRVMLLEQLSRDQPVAVLRAALQLLADDPDPELFPLFSRFVRHDDLVVARLAVMWMRKAGGEAATLRIHRELSDDLRSKDAARRARAAFLLGGYGGSAALDLAAMLEDSSLAVRLNAVESMGQIRSPEFIGPLVRAMGHADLAPAASRALACYGPPLVEALVGVLGEPPPHAAVQLRLFRIIERFATNEACAFLMRYAEPGHGTVVRDGAVQSLWRMAREPDSPRPPRPWLVARVVQDIERLNNLRNVATLTPGTTVRHAFFLGEVAALCLQAEARTFRLLGLLSSRAAMHRAFLYYRSGLQRVRSNAIELLDEHLTEPELKPFVGLVEQRADAARAGPVGRMTAARPGQLSPDPQLLLAAEPWLKRIWVWAEGREEDKVARDPIDLVFLLKAVPLFSELSGEQMLPLADIVREVHIAQGEQVFAEGDPGDRLYVIVEGQADVVYAGSTRSSLKAKDCFGEMALLDQGPRSASVRAGTDLELLAIARDDFQELLDLHPALAREVIRVLTQRLRDANAQQIDVSSSSSLKSSG
jgi:hypothetical protein